MTKKEEIFNYLNQNNEKDREKLIKEIAKKFNFGEGTAVTYYYEWKRKFMGNSNCVPKEEKQFETKQEPKEKVNKQVPHNIKPINASKEEVFKKPKVTIIEGSVNYRNKEYQIKDGALVVGEEKFKNIDDLEEYKKRQLKEFYTQISEISEVLELIQ